MFRSLWQSRTGSSKSQPASRKPSDPRALLRDALLTPALINKDPQRALSLLEQIEQHEPTAARWPHKRGDVLRQMHRDAEAFVAYATAVRLYTDAGRMQLANAMAKTALAVPNASSLLSQLDENTRGAFHAAIPRQERSLSSIVLDLDSLQPSC